MNTRTVAFIEQEGDVVTMTRLPEKIVFDPMPNRGTADLGAMLEMSLIEQDLSNGLADDEGEIV